MMMVESGIATDQFLAVNSNGINDYGKSIRP
jgi:hypothetical protein